MRAVSDLASSKSQWQTPWVMQVCNWRKTCNANRLFNLCQMCSEEKGGPVDDETAHVNKRHERSFRRVWLPDSKNTKRKTALRYGADFICRKYSDTIEYTRRRISDWEAFRARGCKQRHIEKEKWPNEPSEAASDFRRRVSALPLTKARLRRTRF